MAHRTYRVADFMRDAGAKAPERCQFRLLYSRVENAGVLEKDQQRTAAVTVFAEWREVRSDPGAVALVDQRDLGMR